jgi:hypothetical protein
MPASPVHTEPGHVCLDLPTLARPGHTFRACHYLLIHAEPLHDGQSEPFRSKPYRTVASHAAPASTIQSSSRRA